MKATIRAALAGLFTSICLLSEAWAEDIKVEERTQGLAPIIVKLIHDKQADLKRDGLSMMLVEQNFGFAASLADVVVVSKGSIVWQGSAEAQRRWLGV